MDKQLLVASLNTLFLRMKNKKGFTIDRAALTSAYSGAISGLYILLVSMPAGKSYSDKAEWLIRSIHEYISKDVRKGIAAVCVFDTAEEFDQYINYGLHA